MDRGKGWGLRLAVAGTSWHTNGHRSGAGEGKLSGVQVMENLVCGQPLRSRPRPLNATRGVMSELHGVERELEFKRTELGRARQNRCGGEGCR